MWQKVVKTLIYLLVFLVPLFWLPFSFELFEFNKNYLILFLVLLAFLAWLAKMVFEDKKIRVKTGPLDLFVGIFLLAMIFSAVFSVDKTSTLFGFYGRFWPNIISLLSLGLFYFLITNNVKINKSSSGGEGKGGEGKKEEGVMTINSLLKTFLWSSFFVTLTAYLSIFNAWPKIGKAFGVKNFYLPKTFNTVGGSLEQLVVFLGIIFVLLTVYLAFSGKDDSAKEVKENDEGEETKKKGKKKVNKNFWLYLYLFSILFVLILVNSWVVWLMVFISLSLFLIFSFWKRMFKEDVNKLSLTVLFILLALIFILTNPTSEIFHQISAFSNLPKEITPSQSVSWQVGVKGLKSNFLFGSGLGNYTYIFSRYKPMSFLESPYWQIRFDRSGNYISGMIGTTGLVGILSYLILIGMFLIVSWLVLGSKSAEKDINIRLPLFIAFAALIVAQFVYYQNTTLAFTFWLLLSLGVVSWDKPQKEKVFSFKEFPELGLIFSIFFWVMLIAVGLLFFTVSKYYVADSYYRTYLTNPTSQANLVKLEKSTILNKKRVVYHLALARAYLAEINKEFTKKKPDNKKIVNLLALALKEGRLADEISPNRIAVKESLAAMYRDIRGLAKGSLDWGIKMFRKALELDPNNPVLLTELGKLELANKKTENAVKNFTKALEIRHSYIDAGVQLALIDEQNKKEDKAIKRLEGMVAKNPFSIEARFQLARLYYNQKKYDKAVTQLRNVLILYPSHISAHYLLGLTYEKQGKTVKALSEYRKALKLSPNNKSLEKKISQLNGEKISGEGAKKQQNNATSTEKK